MALDYEPQLPHTLGSPLEVIAWTADRFENAAVLLDDSVESEIIADMIAKVRRSVAVIRGSLDDVLDSYEAVILPATDAPAFAYVDEGGRGLVHVAPLTGWDATRIGWWVDRYGIPSHPEVA